MLQDVTFHICNLIKYIRPVNFKSTKNLTLSVAIKCVCMVKIRTNTCYLLLNIVQGSEELLKESVVEVIQRLSKKIDVLESNDQQQKKKIDELESNNQQLKKKIDELESNDKQLKKTVESLKNENEDLRFKVRSLIEKSIT